MSAVARIAFASLVALAFVGPLGATTVADFGIEELVRFAHAGVRARVVATDPGDPARARCELEVDEVLFGQLPGSTLVLELDVRIAGMPDLRPGDEVVLFVNFTNRIETIIGLRWGTYRVRNAELFDHEWRPLEVRIEAAREFLRRRADDDPRSVPYEELRSVVQEVRQRLIAESPNGN